MPQRYPDDFIESCVDAVRCLEKNGHLTAASYLEGEVRRMGVELERTETGIIWRVVK